MDRALERALWGLRHAGDGGDRKKTIARLHSPDELGRRGSGEISEAGHERRAEKAMRFGFLVSSIAIALFGIFSYYAGWRHGSHSAVRAAPIEPLQAEPIRAQVNDDLVLRNLVMPIAGVNLRDIHDTFNEGRAHRKPHEATDILAPKGTPVLAMDDGTIRKLFTSVPGGLTIYQFDPQEIYCYYYAHLDHYLLGLREGDHVRRGE